VRFKDCHAATPEVYVAEGIGTVGVAGSARTEGTRVVQTKIITSEIIVKIRFIHENRTTPKIIIVGALQSFSLN
jgi:hypothetical protein